MTSTQSATYLNNVPSIPEWFAGKNLFITGGTGFMGKILIEKLLRSCPNIGNIYILMRPKKGVNATGRIKMLYNLPVFDRLRKECPNAFSKLVPIDGDAAELNLSLNTEDRNLLIEKVNIVYHCAASVRFDDSLTKALLLNTRGTREMCKLALEMKNIEFFMHVSTTYCNINRKCIDEIVYPPFTDWKKAIELAEKIDPHLLTIMTEKFIYPLPNTYTFSKQLAESVVKDMLNEKILTAICRPSIVVSSVREPEPGYCENFNGPVGIFVGYGKGILRVVYSEPDIVEDFLPVDISIKCLIIQTWECCVIRKDNIKSKELSVFNCANQNKHALPNQKVCEIGIRLLDDYPLDVEIWNPAVVVTPSRYYFYYMVFFYHVLPALLVDSILFLTNNKPMLYKIQKKIFTANMALEHFIMNDWVFKNEKGMGGEKYLKPCDKEAFGYEEDFKIKPEHYFKHAILGAKKCLFNEDIKNIDIARRRHNRMWVLAKVFTIAWYIALFWILFYKLDIVNVIYTKICKYLTKLLMVYK